jgi:hypothetical protein
MLYLLPVAARIYLLGYSFTSFLLKWRLLNRNIKKAVTLPLLALSGSTFTQDERNPLEGTWNLCVVMLKRKGGLSTAS